MAPQNKTAQFCSLALAVFLIFGVSFSQDFSKVNIIIRNHLDPQMNEKGGLRAAN